MAFDGIALPALSLAAGALALWPVKRRGAVRRGAAVAHLAACVLLPLIMWSLHRGTSPEMYTFTCLLAGISAITLSDLVSHTVPDPIVIALTVVGFVHVALFYRSVWWVYVGAAAMVGLFMLVVNLLSRGGLGMGDVKLMAVITLFLGPVPSMGAFLIGSIGGAVIAAILWIRTKDRKHAFAFAPFLALGAAVMVCLG